MKMFLNSISKLSIDSSSKNKSAKDLGIEVITEDEFMKILSEEAVGEGLDSL